MKTDNAPSQFEEWAIINGYPTGKDAAGNYAEPATAAALAAWQASRVSVLVDASDNLTIAWIHGREFQKKLATTEAEQVCAEAYQVVGSLLSDLGVFGSPEATKILDNLSRHRRVHTDVLPWPSFERNPAEEAGDSRRPVSTDLETGNGL